MRSVLVIFSLLLVPVLLAGCSTMRLDEVAKSKPEFNLETYFSGKSRAWGLFQDRFGNVKRQFVVDIVGSRKGNQLELVEDFIYDDGERQRRVWRIERLPSGNYRGLADDVIGEAIGTAKGNALHWQYDLNLAVGDDSWEVTFDDWMFLQPDGTLLNRAEVSKLGFTIGTVFITFRKEVLLEDGAIDKPDT
jgi:hypothetical protein